jgi:hypothetical protein
MKNYLKNLGLKIWNNPIKFGAGAAWWILICRIYYNWWQAEQEYDILIKIYYCLILVVNMCITIAVFSYTNRQKLISIESKLEKENDKKN